MAFRTGAFPGGACRLPRQGPCIVFQTGAFPGKLGLSLVAFASYLCNTHGRCSGLGLSLVASSLVESNILTAICLRFWLLHAVFFDAIPSRPTFQRGMERTQKKNNCKDGLPSRFEATADDCFTSFFRHASSPMFFGIIQCSSGRRVGEGSCSLHST